MKIEHFYPNDGGYHSLSATSILQARGYRDFSEIEGGITSITEIDVSKTDFLFRSKFSN